MALGYRVTGPNGYDDPNIARNIIPRAQQLITQFDAFQDNPWPLLYKQVDAWCPRSKFILTVRPVEKWIRSAVGYFGTEETPMRELIYGFQNGSPIGREQIYKAHFENHNTNVMTYFKDRPDDLLVIDITEGDGWGKLCSFLDKPIPDKPFPHANPARKR